MNSDGKKISFGFNKSSKKSSILPAPPKENKTFELIDCLEGTEIKLKNVVEKVEDAPLVIPLSGDANNIVSRIERESFKNKKPKSESNDEDLRPDSELTIEELAARQLLKEARNKLAQEKDTTKVHTLLLTENSTFQDGVEPSMDDYENVPIEDFGLALLRGMGWKEEISNQSKFVKPDIRPKGLGLGGQKIIDVKAEDVFDKNGKQLVLMEGAFAKIVAGPHKGKLGEIQFCDQWTGRVGVKTSKTNEILVLNELFVVPITKEDYTMGSKVINNVKYEQYKQMEDSESRAAAEETFRSRSDDTNIEKKKKISKHKDSQLSRNQLKLENDSFDEEVYVKKEVSSDDAYEKEKNRSKDENTSRYQEKKKKDHISNRSRDKSSKNHKKTAGRNKRDSSVEYTNSRSRDSSEEYKRRKHEVEGRKMKCKTEYKRRRSPLSSDETMSNIRSRSTSSEDYERNKSKSRYKRRSRSSSTEYKQKKYKDKQHSKQRNRSVKTSSRYSDDDNEKKKDCTKYDTGKESSSEVRHDSKKKIKSRRKKHSSSESDSGNEQSKYVGSRAKTRKHISRP